MNETPEKIIFDFSANEERRDWNIVNDGVMGGISRSTLQINAKDSTGIFSGVLSLENNGGFASVRTTPRNFQLGDYDGLIIRVKGDGNIYSFRLRTNARFDGVSYQKKFKTEKDRWIEVYLPFEEFFPTFRGRKLRNVAPLATEKIQQLGILIAEKQMGKFTLTIDWIKAADFRDVASNF